ncbi:MAG TPA: hypothetical protein VLA93_17135 [Pyrinomonadaceae bacterium]|nr:hypothetical protein [Pyrinomonadaceae bacterium]
MISVRHTTTERIQGADLRRLDALREYVRSALHMARLVLDEVLATRFGDEEPDEYLQLVGKASGELAMLLRMAKRVLPGEEDVAEILEIARALVPYARSPKVYRSLLFRPSRAPMYSLAHFCLVDLGLPHENLDHVARLALQSSVYEANERVPYRMLDAAWTRHLAFGDAELNHPAISLSPLCTGVDLLEATSSDAYAFTHSLPYATDFGRVSLPEHIDRLHLLGIAEAVAVKALDEDDLDLLSEVLMAPAILKLDWTPILSFGWEVLERVWKEFGFVPGPGIPPPASDETRIQKVRRVLGTVYHTTFAAGLCCATLIACRSIPPHVESTTADCSELPPGKGAAWKINWSTSPPEVRENLNFLSLAFSLRRALDHMDLVRVREILGSAAETGLIEHPLFTQSLELLERINAADLTTGSQ